MKENYKGFDLDPIPYQLDKSDQWQVCVGIAKHHEALDITLEKPFLGEEVCVTEEAARTKSIELGKQIVDGEHPEYTVEDIVQPSEQHSSVGSRAAE